MTQYAETLNSCKRKLEDNQMYNLAAENFDFSLDKFSEMKIIRSIRSQEYL